MNQELRDRLIEIGWSEELIQAASSVSEQVDESSVEPISVEWDALAHEKTMDRRDIRIQPSSTDTFVSFNLSLKS